LYASRRSPEIRIDAREIAGKSKNDGKFRTGAPQRSRGGRAGTKYMLN
jgi:hypothetical protein